MIKEIMAFVKPAYVLVLPFYENQQSIPYRN